MKFENFWLVKFSCRQVKNFSFFDEISEISFQIYVMLRRLKSFLDCFDDGVTCPEIFFERSRINSRIKVKILLNRFIIDTSKLGQDV